MTEDRISYLLQAYTNSVATKEEEQELFQWVASTDDDDYIKEHIRKLVNEGAYENFPDVAWDLLYKKVVRKAKVNRRSSWRWYKIAAAAAMLILIIGLGVYFLSEKKPKAIDKSNNTISYYHDDIGPGSTKAILRVGDSQVMLYGRDTSFELGGNKIYIEGGKLKMREDISVRYTVMTPRGGDYRLELPDGTDVWLNADSKLSYSSEFDKQVREVQLSGEAFFDVHRDPARPFIVNTARQRVEVLGTTFNVQAYADETKVTTTLIQGKIKVASSGEKKLLQPGDQISTSPDDKLTIISDADIEQVIAWKNGYFRFDKTDIYTIMDQLSRWYDVDVVYKGDIPDVYFGALIGRNNNISQVLHLLEATGDIHFEIKGRVIIVMP